MEHDSINRIDFLDRLLVKYSNSFNIYKPYQIGEEEYPAYGYFYSHNEKYVLVRKAKMWASDSYEHLLFMDADEITVDDVQKARELIVGHMEEQMVRKGEKYPEENHMLSILTIVLLSTKALKHDVEKMIHHFKFDKGYMMNMRGYCRGRIAAVSMDDRNVVTSPQAKPMKKMLKSVFIEVEAGLPGFDQICEQQGVTPFVQKQD